MAADIEAATLISEQSRKRKSFSHIPKLLPYEKVEVRSVEEGFQGSWHRGTVIEQKNQVRVVKFDHLLCDAGSDGLIESIPVLFAVDGKIPASWRPSSFPNYRGKIRPVPPCLIHNVNCLHYGLCVDVFHEDAWWEGVIFDHDDVSEERLVFFPDLGDELRAPLKNIRLTQDWDAATDKWKLRGDWVFLEVIEELELQWPLLVSVKQIWYEVRIKKRFVNDKMEWTSPVREIWKETIKDVIIDNFRLTMKEFFGRLNTSGDINQDFLDSVAPLFFECLAVAPSDQNLLLVDEDLDDGVDLGPPGFSSLTSNPSTVFTNKATDYSLAGPDLVPRAECCPDAIVEYYDGFVSGNRASVSTAVKVRQHLLYSGWKIECIRKKRGNPSIRYRYTDPTGRRYFSLNDVAKELCKETISSGAERRALRMVESAYCPQAVLRSSKRARKEVSPTYQTPRTVLSWLMDNNVILPRSKVQYRCKEDGQTTKEGRVTRDGIKCSCCQTTFSLHSFGSHAGGSHQRPAANIFLKDGRSLLDCQLQLKRDQIARLSRAELRRVRTNQRQLENDNDYICSVCHYGGDLVLCDQCPSSFHTRCLGLQDVPEGAWFCPSCCCRICNQHRICTDTSILNCEQCERRYHVECLERSGYPPGLETGRELRWFCGSRCEEIFMGLQRLLGKPIPVGRDNLTWTLLKHGKSEWSDHNDMEESTEVYSKLNIVVNVMHECFEPVKEPLTRRDIVEDVIFCRWSELNRLNFKGFYTVLLEKDDELISAATVRVYGERVAEVPLVGTRFQYRRRGMCHVLMNELEKKLVELGVERLVLPAVSSVLHTWTTSFRFAIMTEAEKLNFLGYTFLDFQGTKMCHKLLSRGRPSTDSSISRGNSCHTINKVDITNLDGTSDFSEVSQAERINGADNVGGTPSLEIMTTHVEYQSETSIEGSAGEGEDRKTLLKCYRRRKVAACGSYPVEKCK